MSGPVHYNAFSKRSVFETVRPRPHYRFRSVFPVHTKMLENAAAVICEINSDVSILEILRFRRSH